MVIRQVLVICLLNCTGEVGWVVACSETSSPLFIFSPRCPLTGHSSGFISYSFRTDILSFPLSLLVSYTCQLL